MISLHRVLCFCSVSSSSASLRSPFLYSPLRGSWCGCWNLPLRVAAAALLLVLLLLRGWRTAVASVAAGRRWRKELLLVAAGRRWKKELLLVGKR